MKFSKDGQDKSLIAKAYYLEAVDVKMIDGLTPEQMNLGTSSGEFLYLEELKRLKSYLIFETADIIYLSPDTRSKIDSEVIGVYEDEEEYGGFDGDLKVAIVKQPQGGSVVVIAREKLGGRALTRSFNKGDNFYPQLEKLTNEHYMALGEAFLFEVIYGNVDHMIGGVNLGNFLFSFINNKTYMIDNNITVKGLYRGIDILLERGELDQYRKNFESRASLEKASNSIVKKDQEDFKEFIGKYLNDPYIMFKRLMGSSGFLELIYEAFNKDKTISEEKIQLLHTGFKRALNVVAQRYDQDKTFATNELVKEHDYTFNTILPMLKNRTQIISEMIKERELEAKTDQSGELQQSQAPPSPEDAELEHPLSSTINKDLEIPDKNSSNAKLTKLNIPSNNQISGGQMFRLELDKKVYVIKSIEYEETAQDSPDPKGGLGVLEREKVANQVLRSILGESVVPNSGYIYLETGEQEVYFEAILNGNKLAPPYEINENTTRDQLEQMGMMLFMDLILGNMDRILNLNLANILVDDKEGLHPINTTFSVLNLYLILLHDQFDATPESFLDQYDIKFEYLISVKKQMEDTLIDLLKSVISEFEEDDTITWVFNFMNKVPYEAYSITQSLKASNSAVDEFDALASMSKGFIRGMQLFSSKFDQNTFSKSTHDSVMNQEIDILVDIWISVQNAVKEAVSNIPTEDEQFFNTVELSEEQKVEIKFFKEWFPKRSINLVLGADMFERSQFTRLEPGIQTDNGVIPVNLFFESEARPIEKLLEKGANIKFLTFAIVDELVAAGYIQRMGKYEILTDKYINKVKQPSDIEKYVSLEEDSVLRKHVNSVFRVLEPYQKLLRKDFQQFQGNFSDIKSWETLRNNLKLAGRTIDNIIFDGHVVYFWEMWKTPEIFPILYEILSPGGSFIVPRNKMKHQMNLKNSDSPEYAKFLINQSANKITIKVTDDGRKTFSRVVKDIRFITKKDESPYVTVNQEFLDIVKEDSAIYTPDTKGVFNADNFINPAEDDYFVFDGAIAVVTNAVPEAWETIKLVEGEYDQRHQGTGYYVFTKSQVPIPETKATTPKIDSTVESVENPQESHAQPLPIQVLEKLDSKKTGIYGRLVKTGHYEEGKLKKIVYREMGKNIRIPHKSDINKFAPLSSSKQNLALFGGDTTAKKGGSIVFLSMKDGSHLVQKSVPFFGGSRRHYITTRSYCFTNLS